MDRRRVLAAARDEARRWAGRAITEIVPSRRDFAQYASTQKAGLALIACLTRGVPAQPDEYAAACDAAEVAAIAVDTTPEGFGLGVMQAVADAVTAPILRDDLIIAPAQLYATRAHGADAAILAIAEVDAAALKELLAVAASLHMAAVLEISDRQTLTRALAQPHALLGLRCADAGGWLDVEATLELGSELPPNRTAISLAQPRAIEDALTLAGTCDAAILGAALLGDDIAAAVADLAGA